MMSVIKFRSLFLALFVFTASGYGQAEQTELTPKCETPTIKGDPACWMKAENHENCYVWNPDVGNEEAVIWSGQCRGGKLHGRGKVTWVWQGNDGDTKRLSVSNTGSYEDGKKHGRWVEGRDIGPYVNGKRHGQWVEGSNTGPYVDGKRHGQWVEGSNTGPYVDGKRHGQWVEGSNTGPYVDGKRHGQWVEGRDTGPYVDGKRHGQWVERRGSIADTGPYVDGKKHGWWEGKSIFSGNTSRAGSYVDGKKHGRWHAGFFQKLKPGTLKGDGVTRKKCKRWAHGTKVSEFEC